MTVVLETLKNETIRVTARHTGRTVEYREGVKGDEKKLIVEILNVAASAHKLPNGTFDMTYIVLNDAAKLHY